MGKSRNDRRYRGEDDYDGQEEVQEKRRRKQRNRLQEDFEMNSILDVTPIKNRKDRMWSHR